MRNVQKEFNTMSGSMRVFDTLSHTKKLREAGFSERQAEAQAETFLAIAEDHLATKEGMRALGTDLRHEIALIHRDIKAMEIRMTEQMKTMEMSMTQQIKTMEMDTAQKMKAMDVTIKTLEVSLTQKIEGIKKDLKIWLGGGLMAATTLILTGISAMITLH